MTPCQPASTMVYERGHGPKDLERPMNYDDVAAAAREIADALEALGVEAKADEYGVSCSRQLSRGRQYMGRVGLSMAGEFGGEAAQPIRIDELPTRSRAAIGRTAHRALDAYIARGGPLPRAS